MHASDLDPSTPVLVGVGQCAERIGDHVDRNLGHPFAVRRLVVEGGAEIARFQRRDDPLRDPAGEIDAALRLEHQRDVAGRAAETGDEQRKRLLGDRIGFREGCLGDLGGRCEDGRLAVREGDGAIGVDQPAAA